jgi:putative flippase GtrA
MSYFARYSNNVQQWLEQSATAVPMKTQLSNSRLARYFFVGCFAVTVHFTIMIVGVEAFAIHKPIATTVGFVIAVIVNYCLQRRITFASDVPHIQAAPSFIAAASVLAVVNVVIFSFLIGHINYLTAQVFASMTVFLLNYEFNKRYSFRG